ncbi:MAG: hypothetical protein JSS14_30390 [Proteobacteria bacterium]|nr:hypothetical protein [Pseudomonadota bacterium]
MNVTRCLAAGMVFMVMGFATGHARSATTLLCPGSGSLLDWQTTNSIEYDDEDSNASLARAD